ncbi:MAG: hypothetical protein CMJ51_03490 [Planctomycetaceae bacterium]|nr:hypothetical protein [Planctomycetaceae bacterium]
MLSENNDIACAAWVGDRLASLLERMLEISALSCTHLGGEGPLVRALASRLGIPHLDDPRSLARADSPATLIMDPGTPLSSEVLTAMMDATSNAGRPLLSMTPRPSLVLDQIEDTTHALESGTPPRPMPLFRTLRSGRRLIEATAAFGTPSTATVEVTGPALQGTLGTRLLDAVDLLSEWFGWPGTVQAIATRNAPASDLASRILAVARYSDGRAATIIAGADGGRHSRSVTIHGEAGRLHYANGAVDWSDADGRQIELETPVPSHPDDLARELVESVESAIADRTPLRPLDAMLDLLASCETAMLSTRTGETESFDSVRAMLGRV